MKKALTSLAVLAVMFLVVCSSFLPHYLQSVSLAEPSSLYGGTVNSYQLVTKQDKWYSVGLFEESATTPDATNRTVALFTATDANNLTYVIKPSWSVIKLRCSGWDDGDDFVFDVFFANSSSDHFTRVATLTWKTGTQTSATTSYEFADTLTESNAQWHTTASAVSPEGNYIAEWAVGTGGSKMIGFCPTTNDSNAVLEITGY